MYKLCFYVPASHLEIVKSALFKAGAGQQGEYDCCCWQTQGTGQFRPLSNSQPFIGEKETLSQVDEYKVEMICDNEFIKAALQALIHAHPYEEPAYHAIPITTLSNL